MFKQRALFSDLLNFLPDKRFAIITGARQVGKTSVLRALFNELQNSGREAHYLSFEDNLIANKADEHPERILDFLPVRPRKIIDGQAENMIFLLIDEVQYAKDPSHFLKYLYDTYESNLKIIATGSSAFYIDRKFRDSLAGRKRIFRLNTLNFREYLVFQDENQLVEALDLIRSRSDYRSLRIDGLRHRFWEYLRFGGYPAVALEKDEREKRFTLEELKNAYVRMDMLESRIEYETKFYRLFQMLADQTGNLLNKNALGIDLQLDAKTVDNYIYILEKCFHISLLRPFFSNLRKELTKMPKVYFNDLGMRNALLRRFEPIPDRSDKGQLLENYYFLRLSEKHSQEGVFFWRTTDGLEIDFVLKENDNTGRAIEVKWSPDKKAKQPGLQAFNSIYPGFKMEMLSAEAFWQ